MSKACLAIVITTVAIVSLGRGDPPRQQTRAATLVETDGSAGVEHGGFPGEVKFVFYVGDVAQSVAFYRDVLGFTFHHYHDYVSGESVSEWKRSEPPIYAEMSVAGRRFGIHLPQDDDDKRALGAAKMYFRVKDLAAHHRRVEARGGKPSKLIKRSWMDMFKVTDPNGHRIYFAYTDDALHGNPWFGK